MPVPSRPALFLAALVGLLLGCSGLLTPPADVAQLTAAVDGAAPDTVLNDLYAIAATAGGLGSDCGTCLSAVPGTGEDEVASIAAATLLDPRCSCPSTCASEALDGLSDATDDERMAGIAAACDAVGPDPIFAEDQSAWRAAASPFHYALVRMILDTAADDAFTEAGREPLAHGLGLSRAYTLQPTAEPTLEGADREALADVQEDLAACEEDLAHRLLVEPDGVVVAATGSDPDATCATGVLSAWTLPAGAHRVVDLTARASALPDPGDGDEGGDDPPGRRRPRPRPDQPPARPSPRPSPGGSMPSAVKRVLRGRSSQIRTCYERALARDPELSGTLQLEFVIGGSGSVTSARATGPFPEAFSSCVVGVIEGTTFPAPPDGEATTIRYPFVFTPQR